MLHMFPGVSNRKLLVTDKILFEKFKSFIKSIIIKCGNHKQLILECGSTELRNVVNEGLIALFPKLSPFDFFITFSGSSSLTNNQISITANGLINMSAALECSSYQKGELQSVVDLRPILKEIFPAKYTFMPQIDLPILVKRVTHLEAENHALKELVNNLHKRLHALEQANSTPRATTNPEEEVERDDKTFKSLKRSLGN